MYRGVKKEAAGAAATENVGSSKADVRNTLAWECLYYAQQLGESVRWLARPR
jgi:hypothetical protein